MMDRYALTLVAIMALSTLFLRAIPFIVFSKDVPDSILFLGKALPFASMAMLVVYCLKGMDLSSSNHGMPEILATLFVILIHKWKKNVLLSVFASTIFYMLLVQRIF
ncbi:MAG: AzlD domain-containing protein [Holdemanella sp.]|nr:AzlD domain-containing protein [Holdemanella sp.]